MSCRVVRLVLAMVLALAGSVILSRPFSTSAAQPSVYVHAGTYYVNTVAVPGDKVQVGGTGFVPGEFVQVTAQFPLYSGKTQTVSTRINTDNTGSFNNLLITVPGDAKAQNDFVTLRGVRSGRTGRATVTVRYQPSIALNPNTTGPGQSVAVSGHGFVPYTPVDVSVYVNRINTFGITIRNVAYAGAAGNIGTALTLPSDVAAGQYTVQAVDGTGNFTARTALTVNRAPAATATPAPAPTATPLPPVSLPPAPVPALPKANGVGFQWISLWYHVVRHGTWDEVVVQGTPHVTYGIWVHVIFANGRHYDYYQNTDSNGQWRTRFNIPNNVNTRYSNQARVEFQLWRGSKTVKTYVTFTVV